MRDEIGAGVLSGSKGVGAGVEKLPPRFAFSGAPVHEASGLGLAVSTWTQTDKNILLYKCVLSPTVCVFVCVCGPILIQVIRQVFHEQKTKSFLASQVNTPPKNQLLTTSSNLKPFSKKS